MKYFTPKLISDYKVGKVRDYKFKWGRTERKYVNDVQKLKKRLSLNAREAMSHCVFSFLSIVKILEQRPVDHHKAYMRQKGCVIIVLQGNDSCATLIYETVADMVAHHHCYPGFDNHPKSENYDEYMKKEVANEYEKRWLYAEMSQSKIGRLKYNILCSDGIEYEIAFTDLKVIQGFYNDF